MVGRELVLQPCDGPWLLRFYADGAWRGPYAGRQVGLNDDNASWLLPRPELDRARRVLGLPQLRDTEGGGDRA